MDNEFSAEIAGYHPPYNVDAWVGNNLVLHTTTRTMFGAYLRVLRAKLTAKLDSPRQG